MARQDVARRQESGDWPGAIQLLLAVRAALAQLKPLQCVKQLAQSLQLQYQQIEGRLEQALGQLVRTFDPDRYSRVLVGLRLFVPEDRLSQLMLDLAEVLEEK